MTETNDTDDQQAEATRKAMLIVAYDELTNVRNLEDDTDIVRQILRAYAAINRANVARRDEIEKTGGVYYWVDAHSIVASAYYAAIEGIPIEEMAPISVRGEQLVNLMVAAQAMTHAACMDYLTADCDPDGEVQAEIVLSALEANVAENARWRKRREAAEQRGKP